MQQEDADRAMTEILEDDREKAEAVTGS